MYDRWTTTEELPSAQVVSPLAGLAGDCLDVLPTPRGRGALPDVASVEIRGGFTCCPVTTSWPYWPICGPTELALLDSEPSAGFGISAKF
jgi:hypothetical protein